MTEKLVKYIVQQIEKKEVDTERHKDNAENLAYWRGYNLGIENAARAVKESLPHAFWYKDEDEK